RDRWAIGNEPFTTARVWRGANFTAPNAQCVFQSVRNQAGMAQQNWQAGSLCEPLHGHPVYPPGGCPPRASRPRGGSPPRLGRLFLHLAVVLAHPILIGLGAPGV